MGAFCDGVNFTQIARQVRCKWGDNKETLGKLQGVLDKYLAEFKSFAEGNGRRFLKRICLGRVESQI